MDIICFLTGQIPVQYSEQPTSNLTYFKALSGTCCLPMDLKVYVPLFCEALTQLSFCKFYPTHNLQYFVEVTTVDITAH